MAMTTCRECGKEVSSEARSCPHCGVSAPGRRGVHISTGAGCLIIAIVLLLSLLYLGNESGGRAPSSAARSTLTTPPTPSGPLLVLRSWSWSTEYGYATASGEVKNISGAPLSNVEAIVSFYDRNGTFITSDDALIDYNPVMPGQTSPFKVMATENPAMKTARIEFKELMGTTIPYADSSHRRRGR